MLTLCDNAGEAASAISPALIKLADYPVEVRGVWRAPVLWTMSISARLRGDFSR
jgi:hypothetical protein